MENTNLNFSHIVQMFNEADELIKNLKCQIQFLEQEIKELKIEKEERNQDEVLRGILKPDETKDFIMQKLTEDLYLENIAEEIENYHVGIEADEYGDEIRVTKNVDVWSIKESIKTFFRNEVESFINQHKDRIKILDES